MISTLRFSIVSTLLVALTACGFHLRGPSEIPFQSVFISGNTLVISQNLKRALNTSKIAIVSDPKEAELQLELVGEENEKRILSLAGDGTVNEYELYYRVHYRTKLATEQRWSDVETVEARRDFTYSDDRLLAKQVEEKRLNDYMHDYVINNLMRRLSALKATQ